jgi:hypothetical protein
MKNQIFDQEDLTPEFLKTENFKRPSSFHFNKIKFAKSIKNHLEVVHIVIAKDSMVEYLNRIDLQVKRLFKTPKDKV